ncbi:MAG: hypothetical protein U0941_23510 [Planctomycetaceae bacterium]
MCVEFKGLPDRRYQYFWCDGFLPNDDDHENPLSRIIGKCWICNGADQMNWDFALLLPSPVISRAEIDWGALMPPDNVTRWMSFDEHRQYIEIEPAAAVPDLA